MNESQRQQALLAALAAPAASVADLALRETGQRAARGLEAYRANAEAVSERALASVFATIKAMVGEADFRQLARAFWRAHPPQRGDLGEWGGEFPAWLAAHAAMAHWPWLGDCARLDLALHRNERAADAVFDAASLVLLESTEPTHVRLQLMPGTEVLRSVWPIASVHRAHQLAGDEAERAFEVARARIAAHAGEQVLVVRKGWRAVAHPLDPASADWVRCLLDGSCLAEALDQAGEGFDFAAWLGNALRESWLKGVIAAND